MSPWEFRRMRADLMKYQAQVVKLEDRIDQLHKNNKEAVIFFDKEKSEMKSQLETNRSSVSSLVNLSFWNRNKYDVNFVFQIKDLEYRLNIVRKREIECREELNETKTAHELDKLKLKTKIRELENEADELRAHIFGVLYLKFLTSLLCTNFNHKHFFTYFSWNLAQKIQTRSCKLRFEN